jgi:thioredoxin-dependent peroxiredoxin
MTPTATHVAALVAALALVPLAACADSPAEPIAAAATAPSAEAGAERTGLVRRGETPYTLVGPALEVGASAPTAGLRGDGFKPVSVDFTDGTVRVVLTVPSLDTPTCSLETRTFNERATSLGDGVEVIVVSRDLPPAQARFCAAHGIERVRALSDYFDGAFGRAWGLYMKENGLLARAVLVLDGGGVVRYQQIVENVPDEPDYDAALAAVTALAPASK